MPPLRGYGCWLCSVMLQSFHPFGVYQSYFDICIKTALIHIGLIFSINISIAKIFFHIDATNPVGMI
jgi:hypothetical protein